MAEENIARLLETYDAFVEGQLERIPEFFDPDGFYRTSGVFPGMQERYVGHDGIAEFWHAANEPWEWFEIEPLRTAAEGDCVAAEVQFRGRGAGSGVEVTIEAGHLVRFRDGSIIEFAAFASWEQALAAFERCPARAAA
jgi:ketosteroid isomerase-like protein